MRATDTLGIIASRYPLPWLLFTMRTPTGGPSDWVSASPSAGWHLPTTRAACYTGVDGLARTAAEGGTADGTGRGWYPGCRRRCGPSRCGRDPVRGLPALPVPPLGRKEPGPVAIRSPRTAGVGARA